MPLRKTIEAQMYEEHTIEKQIAEIICASKNSPLISFLSEWACIAASDLSVMIHGETGVGKDVLARVLHKFSNRAQGPFVPVNCGALPDNLLESELFGVRKGAFTGAVRDILGKIPAANKGTLFLDEVGELSKGAQKKLLRVLQEKQVSAVGEAVERPTDFRLITASHRNLMSMVRNGSFREDLYYRILMYQVNLPPLRKRKMDLLPLIKAMGFDNLFDENSQNDSSEKLFDRMKKWEWPGNIRELRNVLERMQALQVIGRDKMTVFSQHKETSKSGFQPEITSKQNKILQAMEDAAWNQTRAAIALGISRGSLQYQLRKVFGSTIGGSPYGGCMPEKPMRETSIAMV